MSLDCHIVADDGVKFGLAYEPSIQAIGEFDDARKITDLHTFPVQYHPDAVRITAAALLQGRRFAQFKAAQVMETSGPAMFQKRDAAFIYHTIKVSTHGRTIVDPAGFRSYNPGLPRMPSVVHRVRSRDALAEEEYIICTPVVLGLCLGTKKWGGFAISRLLDLRWNPQPFQDLVREERAKKLVHSLIKRHSPDDGFDDLVAGKGKGIISLFSGPPGSVKTLTAEAVAESTRRPLYICSAGDLGSTAAGIDLNLPRILELSARWNSVLLIDEADVFLQQRTELDIHRNALISTFLRQLESYQRLLILTTNRIGSCDEAFESRIHIAIRYPDLDTATRRQIWTTFLKRAHNLLGQTTEMGIAEDGISRLANIKVNGRQVSTSYPLSSRRTLTVTHRSRTLSTRRELWQRTKAKHCPCRTLVILILEVTSAGLGQDWNLAEQLEYVWDSANISLSFPSFRLAIYVHISTRIPITIYTSSPTQDISSHPLKPRQPCPPWQPGTP